MARMKGKTALVTGASAGIGYATVERLAKEGINVIGCARNVESLEKLRETLPKGSGSVCAVKCDLAKEQDILRMFKAVEEKYKHLDILVNNAGRFDVADLITSDTAPWRAMLDLNILGLSICVRETLRLMDKDGVNDGHIVNINSLAGHTMPNYPMVHFYSATKHMVTALTEALYQEVKAKKDSKIRVTVRSISPGAVDTPGVDAISKSLGMEALKSFKNLEPKDIADAVFYVISAPAHVCVKEIKLISVEQSPL